jgi:signal transduction histidine kinase
MKYRWYIGGVATAGLVSMVFAHMLWPGEWAGKEMAIMGLTAALVGTALAYPLKVSPQADASLAIAPLFMGVLLLSPVQAGGASAVGSISADLWLRRRKEVATFNAAIVILAVGLSGMVFQSLGGSADGVLLSAEVLGAAVLAGIVLHATNMVTMVGMVSIRKGSSFLGIWKRAWIMDNVQEAAILPLGFLAAVLWHEAWWSMLFLVIPMALAYIALSRSVKEVRENIELASRLKKQMDELKTTQAQLIQSAKMASVGTLAAGVAHEINNPLFAILGRAELLLRAPEKHLASMKGREYIEAIHEMAQRAAKIVQELLAYSRPSVTPRQVKLSEAMDVALNLVGRDVANKGIEIQKEYSDNSFIQGWPDKIEQVFVNLLMNARDASESGSRIFIRCWAQDGSANISVQDNGRGIPQSIQHRLFEPFFTTKEVGKGTGLGLYVCHRIVTEHKGTIEIRSEEGAGTEVTLRFPVTRQSMVEKLTAGIT